MTDRELLNTSASYLRKRLREWVALKIAPWLFVPYAKEREEAFRDLAEVAYGSRDAIWTSPRVLVDVALKSYPLASWPVRGEDE